jgi:hypothetical protein
MATVMKYRYMGYQHCKRPIAQSGYLAKRIGHDTWSYDTSISPGLGSTGEVRAEGRSAIACGNCANIAIDLARRKGAVCTIFVERMVLEPASTRIG